jgi:hypothetical protein
MAYSAEISRVHPSCVLFIIDQSGSMADRFASGEFIRSKAEGVADAINRLLQNLVIKCAKGEGVRDYYHVGVLGYGRTVGPRLPGSLTGAGLVPISQIANSPLRMEQRNQKSLDLQGNLVDQPVRFPVWFDPVARGRTPMCAALRCALETLSSWVMSQPSSFPPIVIHISDGGATDGDPAGPAEGIRNLQTSDGAALLFNINLSSRGGPSVEFPTSGSGLPDRYARRLFEMSSILPPHMIAAAQNDGYSVSASSRGFAYNADLVALIRFLDIGTRPGNFR